MPAVAEYLVIWLEALAGGLHAAVGFPVFTDSWSNVFRDPVGAHERRVDGGFQGWDRRARHARCLYGVYSSPVDPLG